MRHSALTAAALACAAPAVAAEPPAYPAGADPEIARSLPSPEVMDRAARTVDAVVGAVMNVPVGPIVEAANPGRKLSKRERSQTVRDVATRDDPYAEERMRREMGAITAGMGDMAVQLAVITPILRQTVEDAQRRIEAATRDLPSRRAPTPDYDRDLDRDQDPRDPD